MAAVLAFALSVPTAGNAGAAGDGGASSRISGDGRIITTIFGSGSSSGRRTTSVRAYWATFSAAQVAYLLQVASVRPDIAGHPVVRQLADRAAAGAVDDLSVQYRVLDGRATGEVRIVSVAPGTTSTWSSQMVTVLPALRATLSPPGGLTVPVGEPVFVSFAPPVWNQVVDRTLVSRGRTARVRAWPVRFEVRTGDPASVGEVLRCTGAGRPFDPLDPRSPARQANGAGSCAVTYRSRTGVPGRPDAWLGDITVWWWAEWTTDGRSWSPLGEIPKLTLLRRSVGEVRTQLESRP
ncbi:MAG: hypothetical protein ACOYOQ_12045 [Microthrixaceae bacterium]